MSSRNHALSEEFSWRQVLHCSVPLLANVVVVKSAVRILDHGPLRVKGLRYTVMLLRWSGGSWRVRRPSAGELGSTAWRSEIWNRERSPLHS